MGKGIGQGTGRLKSPADAAEWSHASAADGSTGLGSGRALALASIHIVIRHSLLRDTRGALNLLEMELHDVDARLEDKHMHLARGWQQLKVAIKLSHLQPESACSKDEESTPR